VTNFHILIPSYNCQRWIERCLESVSVQTIQPSGVLVIDDDSPEHGYSELALQQCKNRGFSYLRNSDNLKCPFNIWMGVKVLDPDPEDVIFLLDGDDFLPHGKVLERFAEVYSDPEIWLTYGNYAPHPRNTGQVRAAAYPPEVVRSRNFRTAGNLFNHPLTFRRFLFDEIRREDLQNNNGEWFRGGYDYAIMAPMLEMAYANYRFLDEDLYMYNAVNPISDSHVNVSLINETDQLRTRAKKGILQR